MKISEQKLTEVIENTIKSFLTEKTISQKKKDVLDVENFFKKGKSGSNSIKSMVVFTAENPDSTEISRNENKKRNKSLLNTLKQSGYHFVPAIGQFYGNPEHPYIVFNMSLKTAKYLCGLYQQTSFVWSELKDNGIHSEYWEKQDVTSKYNPQHNDYIIKDTCDTWVNQSNADDGFTIVGKKFKYSIPFSIFENVNTKFSNNIKLIIESEKKRSKVVLSEDTIIDFAMNGVGQSPLLYRKAIIKNC